MLRIKSINVYKMSNWTDENFLRTDQNKPLNLFHFKNQFGKTTLYNIIRCLLSGHDLTKKNISPLVVGSASMLISDGEKNYKLMANHTDFFFEIDNAASNDYEKYCFEEILGKCYTTERIHYGQQEKTSISSLLRFSFFSDEDFSSKDSNESDLIHVEFDGKGKVILLRYVLGQILKSNKTWETAFSKVNQLSSVNKEIAKAQKQLDSGDAQKAKQLDSSLFHDTGNKYKELQNDKLEFENLKKAIQRIEILKIKSEEIQLGQDCIDFLSQELLFLETAKKSLEEDIDNKEKDISAFTVNPKDLLTYDQWKNRKDSLEGTKRAIEEELENLFPIDAENVIQKYLDIVQRIKGEEFYFDLDMADLKVKLPGMSSEGILKGSKFIANLCLQIYAATFYKDDKKIPLLPIGVYDSVFGGSDVDIIIKCFESMKQLEQTILNNLQIFVFTNRYNRIKTTNEIDLFLEENSDLIYNYILPSDQSFLFK